MSQPTPAPTPAPTNPAPTPPTPAPAPPADPPKPTDDGAKFTQADVDRMIGERLARQKTQYADYDDLKKQAAEYQKYIESQKTEAEKAVDAARKEGAATVLAQVNARAISAEVRAQAAALKFHDPADAVKQLADETKTVKVADDGTVDAEAIKAALAKLAADKPYLVNGDPAPAPSLGGGTRTPAPQNVGTGLQRLQSVERKR